MPCTACSNLMAPTDAPALLDILSCQSSVSLLLTGLGLGEGLGLGLGTGEGLGLGDCVGGEHCLCAMWIVSTLPFGKLGAQQPASGNC